MDAGIALRQLAATQDGTVTLAQARAAGLTFEDVQRHCRAGRWRPLARAVYRIDGVAAPARRARIRATVTSFGPRAFAVLDTAAELLGIAGLPQRDHIHVSLPGVAARARRSTDAAVSVHQLVVRERQVGSVDGIPCTSPARTVADLILRQNRLTAVSLLDSALNRGLVAVDDLADISAMLRGRRSAVDARRWLAQADGRAQSPLETRVRLRCQDGRVPPDVLQHVVRDGGGHLLGIADFAWLGARLIGEADGRGPHDEVTAVYRDRRRQNQFAAHGWKTVRFTWADTMDPGYIPYIVRTAMSRPTVR
jgi:hypothetical protein